MHLKRIDPGFTSNGAYFFQNDVQNITIEPRFSLLEKKLELSASFGMQKDNLDEEKLLQTNRTIGSASVRFSDGPFQADAGFSNYDRITSYNVCYTKLLRPIFNKREPEPQVGSYTVVSALV